jgi:uncharacterized damage-inducible protein DinB
MSTAAPAASAVLDTFRHQAGMIRAVVGMNLEGMSHEDSLETPRPHGNSANWVLGHVTCVYNNFLPLLNEQPVVDKAVLARYDRGSPPITADSALPLDELRAAWQSVADRVDAGLGALDAEALEQHAPFSPSNNPNETVRSLISTVMFHQAYHAGQLGILRRVAGKDGAIR